MASIELPTAGAGSEDRRLRRMSDKEWWAILDMLAAVAFASLLLGNV
jgi:hypothetical protein